jgi:hypothetical protein
MMQIKQQKATNYIRIDVENKIAELIEKNNALCQIISSQEAYLEILKRQQLNPQFRPPITSAEIREKDAHLNARLISSIELESNKGVARDLLDPNKKHWSVVCAMTIVIENILAILKPYNNVTKSQFSKHFLAA